MTRSAAKSRAAKTTGAGKASARTSRTRGAGTAAAKKTTTRKSQVAKKTPAPRRTAGTKAKPARAPRTVTPSRKDTVKKEKTMTAPAAPPRVTGAVEAPAAVKLTKRLRELREMLLGERARILAEARKHAVTDHGEAHGDLADRSTDLSEREFQMELAEHDKVLMARITKALGMIATGEYGICQECGEPISPKRLQALPTAEYCITCQAQLEREGLI